MNDNYNHFHSGIMYIVENIPGPYVDDKEYEDLIDEFNSQYTKHCNCIEHCKKSVCSCFDEAHPNYVKYFHNGETKYKLNFKNIYPIMECNNLCECSSNCGNRLVQRGPLMDLIIRACKNERKGRGLFTKNFIPKGTFICEYAGEVITKSQALLRHQKKHLKGNMNYIFCLNEHSRSGLIQTFVDPSEFGNIGRYINHSCEPNCEIIPVRVNSVIPKLAVFCHEDIDTDTEITFNYGSHNLNDTILDGDDKRKECLCGSKGCRGLMPFEVY